MFILPSGEADEAMFHMLGAVRPIPVRVPVFRERDEHDLFQASEEGIGVDNANESTRDKKCTVLKL
jgi:hypothetical protein